MSTTYPGAGAVTRPAHGAVSSAASASHTSIPVATLAGETPASTAEAVSRGSP